MKVFIRVLQITIATLMSAAVVLTCISVGVDMEKENAKETTNEEQTTKEVVKETTTKSKETKKSTTKRTRSTEEQSSDLSEENTTVETEEVETEIMEYQEETDCKVLEDTCSELDTYSELETEEQLYSQLTPESGMNWYQDHYEVYYSENVLPGEGLEIPGRYTDENGIVRDGEGYVVLATDWNYIPYGSIVDTSWGLGRVYDTGTDYGYVELYVGW